MLNWLLLGDCDILAANYYVLSCTVPALVLNLFLNILGQEKAFFEGQDKLESIINQNAV